jgi:hypothetical protein
LIISAIAVNPCDEVAPSRGWHTAVERGELDAEVNLDVLADLIYGAKWYRFLLYPAPLDAQFAHDIVELVMRLKN